MLLLLADRGSFDNETWTRTVIVEEGYQEGFLALVSPGLLSFLLLLLATCCPTAVIGAADFQFQRGRSLKDGWRGSFE